MLQTARNQSESALWTVRPDGSHFTKLFEDRKGRFVISSNWSPDGTHIMFALRKGLDAPADVLVAKSHGAASILYVADSGNGRVLQFSVGA